ncbi:MAG: radical SAM protein [Acidimicrobiia bacterium]
MTTTTNASTALATSVYALRAEVGEDSVMWSSTRTGHHILLDLTNDALVQKGLLDDLDDQLLGLLYATGILVPSHWDERQAAQDAYREEQDASDTLLLTISPTVACNLRCGYCFEADHPARAMPKAEQDQLVRFVKQNISGRQALAVTWFGGEPTLQIDTILSLSRRLMQVASFAGAGYSATMISNGTLIDDAMAEALANARVSSVQITMDGVAEVHDLLRPSASGRGSYETTLNGVAAAYRHLSVSLRVNIDRRNVEGVPALLEDLAQRELFVNLGFVRVEPAAVYQPENLDSVPESFLTVPEFAAVEVELYERARELGFSMAVAFDTSSSTPCAAVKSSHFAFEPGGRVKRCWAEVADDNKVVASLGVVGLTVSAEADERWRTYEPFDTGCEGCPFLPVCWGGCPKARLDGAMSIATSDAERKKFKELYVCNPRRFNWHELAKRGFVA